MGKQSEVPRLGTSEHQVGSPSGGRWRVYLDWVVIDGRAEVGRLTIGQWADDEAWPVTSSILRHLTAEKLEAGRASVRKEFEKWARNSGQERVRRAADRFKATKRRPVTGKDGRPLTPTEALEEVARVYREAWTAGHSKPTYAVKEAFNLSYSAAAKRVARARDEGFLPKTTRGRAKGGM